MYWLCIHDIATRQTSELRNDKALQQARTSDTKIHPASEWIQGSERKPRRRGIPAETQEAKLESRKCPWLRQWQSFIALSSNRIRKVGSRVRILARSNGRTIIKRIHILTGQGSRRTHNWSHTSTRADCGTPADKRVRLNNWPA